MTRLSRRQVVQGLGAVSLGLLAGCGRWSGQAQAPKVRRIAYLFASPPNAASDANISAFRQGMRELGYVEGQNLLIEERYASGVYQLAAPAAELVRLQPEVILVPSGTARAATTTLPIVSAGAGDVVTAELAASYARPGGNVTGLSTPSLAGKQLQLLQEVVPTLSRVAVLFAATNADFRREPFEAAARTLGLQVHFVGTVDSKDLEVAFEAVLREHADGLLLSAGPVNSGNQTRIAELALQHRLPSMWAQSAAMGRGGLMAYAPNRAAQHRRAAYYVDRILQGTSPADLPVEQPREFDCIINARTAHALGLTIPHHILLQATEVLQ
jgi:putative tryptophan/tyrosine transport system substrate-binding protein